MAEGRDNLQKIFDILKRSDEHRARSALIGALDEKDSNIKLLAVDSLMARTNDEEALREVLKRYNEYPVAIRATLGQDEKVFFRSALELVKHPVESSRVTALNYYAEAGTPGILELIMFLINVPEDAVKLALIEAVYRIIGRFLKAKAEFESDFKSAGHGTSESEEDKAELAERKTRLAQNEHRIIRALTNSLAFFETHHEEGFVRQLTSLGRRGYEALARFLKRDDTELADTIYHILRESDDGDTVGALVWAAAAADSVVRERGAEIVQAHDPASFMNGLWEYFSTTGEKELAELGSRMETLPWLKMLEKYSNDLDAEFLLKNIVVAANVQDDTSLASLAVVAAGKDFTDVHMRTIDFLGRKGSGKTFAVLARFVSSPDVKVRRGAFRAAVKADAPNRERVFLPLTKDPDPDLRAEASHDVSRVSYAKFKGAYQNLDQATRRYALLAIIKMDESIVSTIDAEIDGEEPESLIRGLGIIELLDREKAVAGRIVQLAQHSDIGIRAAAVRLLGKTGTPEAVKMLIASISYKDRRVRGAAIEALQFVDHPRIRKVLWAYVKSPDNRLRANAIRALWGVGEKKVEADLLEMLRSEDELLRRSGVWVLSEIEYPHAVNVLGEMAENDPIALVREKARLALKKIYVREKSKAQAQASGIAGY